MFTAFCFCCKANITTLDEKDFHKSGHVNDRESAKKKYDINPAFLNKTIKTGPTYHALSNG